MNLKEGYYLALYIEINGMAYAYDVDTQRHDQNISLWHYSNGNLLLIRYWELERITRIKHHNKAFRSKEHAIEFISSLLKEIDLSMDDIVGIIGCPELGAPEDKDPTNDLYYYHSLCHLYSTLMLNTEVFKANKMLAFSMDLDSDCLNEERSSYKHDYIGCYSDKGDIKFFSIESPAPLWSIVSHDRKMGEGTLMALASASKTKFKREFDFSEYSFFTSSYKMNYNVYSEIKVVENMCHEDNYEEFLIDYDENFSFEDNLSSASMKAIQQLSQEIVERNIRRALEEFNLTSREVWLALSGGFALNCPCNSFLMNKFRFMGFMAPPCVNDSGQSMGMALYYFYQKDSKVNFKFENAFYGNEFSINEIMRDFGDYVVSCTPTNEEDFVKDILNDSIIWFDGKSEIGPRALGHRSILSSPISIYSKNRLNEIKLRQKWRPVAPIVLEEYASDYFENVNISPFMLRTFKVTGNKLDEISAVAHLDRSSRIQTIAKDSDNIAKAIEWFGEHTGVYMLCNTSLNDRGEPIIDAPFEAINFAYKKGLSVLYLCNYRIELDLTKPFDIDRYYKHKWRTEESNEEDYPLSKEEFVFCYWTGGLAKLDLSDVKNIKLIKRMYNAYSTTDDWKEKHSLSSFYY